MSQNAAQHPRTGMVCVAAQEQRGVFAVFAISDALPPPPRATYHPTAGVAEAPRRLVLQRSPRQTGSPGRPAFVFN